MSESTPVFCLAIFLAQPQSYQIANPGVATATFVATGVGSSNAAYGIGGYWMLTNAANPNGLALAGGLITPTARR